MPADYRVGKLRSGPSEPPAIAQYRAEGGLVSIPAERPYVEAINFGSLLESGRTKVLRAGVRRSEGTF